MSLVKEDVVGMVGVELHLLLLAATLEASGRGNISIGSVTGDNDRRALQKIWRAMLLEKAELSAAKSVNKLAWRSSPHA